MIKTVRRVALFVALSLGFLVAAIAPTAHAAPNISVACTQAEDNFYKCTISGSVTQSVTEFNWALASGVQVAYGVYPMSSGHGTVEYTPTKVIVRFTDEYVANHTDLTFNGFVDVRIDSWSHAGPYTITLEEANTITLVGQGYCDVDCQGSPYQGLYKTMWDSASGTIDGQVVVGQREATALLNQQVTIKELGGAGLENCVFVRMERQDDTVRTLWHEVDFTGAGTDTAVFTVAVPEAHRTFFQCGVLNQAPKVSNQVTINGEVVQSDWTRRLAGADGGGVLKLKPGATVSPSTSSEDTSTAEVPPTTTAVTAKVLPARPGLPKAGD